MTIHFFTENTKKMEKLKSQIGRLEDLIMNYQFNEAGEFISEHIKGASIIKTLHILAEGECGLLVYSFIQNRLQAHETSFWHQAACTILLESLSGIQGRDQAGFYHLRRAIDLAPNDWTLKEHALNFYRDGLMPLEFAKQMAEEVLDHDPQNKMAEEVLGVFFV